MSNQSLSQRVIKGGFWVFSLRIINKLFGLTRLVILARVLAPDDFGLMGIALLTMATLETFSQTGFQVALVQKRDDIKSYLDSAWTVSILRGFILFVILYLISPYVANFFETPESKPIIQVIGLSILLQAFTNIGIIYFQKELEFKKQFIYKFSGTLANFIVSVSATLILRNVWALVFGLVARDFVKFIASYILHPYRPQLSFDLMRAKELWGFGRWVFGSSALIFLITQGDDIFVGKLLGVTALGFYQLAYRIANMPATEITHVISQITFPAYSKLQDNIPKLKEAYLKVLQLTAFLSFPVAGLIFVLAPDFTRIFLGEKWMPMVPAMQVLVFTGLVRSIAATAGPIFQSIGKPKIDTILQIIRLSILVILIYPFTNKWGITGTSFVVLLSIFISNIGFCIMAIKITKCDIGSFAKTIVFPLVNVTIVVLLVLVLKTTMSSGIFEFIILTLIGLFTYILTTYLSNKFLNYKISALMKSIVYARSEESI